MTSIRRYLLLLLISALVLIIFSAAIHGYRAAGAVSAQLLDNELKSVLHTVALSHGYPSPGQDDSPIAYQIWQNNRLLAHSDNIPATALPGLGNSAFSDINFNNQRWRVYSRPIPTTDITVVVAQPLQNRVSLTENLITAAITPFIISVPLLALIIFLSISRGLGPLKSLSQQLSARKGKDLSLIKLRQTPTELTPVVDTLNSMFVRLNDAFEREQQFASNAAHELRTPLSVMKINLHNLAGQLPEPSAQLDAIAQDTNRMIHVVNQILLLSRTSPELFNQQLCSVDIVAVAQKLIADMYSKIDARQQDISLTGEQGLVASTEFTLYTLLQNLVGNANNYAPVGATIEVSVMQDEQYVTLAVDDSGPGIDEAERQNVLQRFYRDHHQTLYKSAGSGLGLAIVSQIVELHQATVTLDKSHLGGLRVAVRFARYEESA
ncbi:ATP-binding protein [Salinimonas lutimaris]|uniref:ATP-binding protein n=1 Tax=Salinimonas lutimaris TaxID=914153 RepID=UPI0010BFB49B|nr:ATP-binding protein [Salinimonas lutimaris]